MSSLAAHTSKIRHFSDLPNHLQRSASVSAGKHLRKAAVAEQKTLWCWGKADISYWDGEGWEAAESNTYIYNSQGKITEELNTGVEGYASRTTYTYNDNGMRTRQLSQSAEDGENFENYRLQETEYDSRLVNVITSNYDYLWQDDEWMQRGNNYRRTITRDANGNITSVVIATIYEDEFDPTEKIDITYGADGKPVTIAQQQLTLNDEGDGFVWETGVVFSDLQWIECDGQIVTADFLTSGANRMLSGKISDEGMDADFTIEYDPNNDNNHEIKVTYYDAEEDEDVEITLNYVQLDDNGSFRLVSTYNFIYMGDPYWTEIYIETGSYDAYGLVLLEQTEFSDGTYQELEDSYRGDVVYDPTYGYPLEYTTRYYDYDEEDFVNELQVKFSDYVDASQSGVSNVGVDGATDAVEYYNLQGLKVSNPEAGQILIVRRGNQVTKEIIR